MRPRIAIPKTSGTKNGSSEPVDFKNKKEPSRCKERSALEGLIFKGFKHFSGKKTSCLLGFRRFFLSDNPSSR